MCGIAGIFEYGRAVGHVSDHVLAAMRDSMAHRGPDDKGTWVSPDSRIGLAHRRLAILDLAHGSQPMVGPTGDVLVFNGEIYNYPALRRELEEDGVVFRTTCDTEVILHLYRRHGDRLVDRLNGMFAFALWDPAERRLLLARDRVGEKPLYVAETHGRLVFGSEIKALLAHPAVTAAVRSDALPGYLANLVTPGPGTLYDGIEKLPPGTTMTCDESGVRRRRYWDLATDRSWRPDSEPEARATVRSLLERSVNDRLLSDVPVGVLLSGGVDSTTLLALLHERAAGIPTFSVGFAGDTKIDERHHARLVAAHYGSDHHEVVITDRQALDHLPRLIYHQDEPLADPVCVPLSFACGLARAHDVPVVLAGEGADEAFWGYPRYREVLRRWPLIRRLLALPRGLRRQLPRLAGRTRNHWTREVLDQIARGRLSPIHFPLGTTSSQIASILSAGSEGVLTAPGQGPPVPEERPIDALVFDTQEYEFGVRLPELLLMRIDRFSMEHGVEARAPFLDPALLEYVYRLPLAIRMREGRPKALLKDAVKDIVPDWVLNRPKQGFGAPISTWLADAVGQILPELFDGEGVRAYFDRPALDGAIAGLKAGNANEAWVLWPVLNFALWHRFWIEGEPIDDFGFARSSGLPTAGRP